MSDDVWEEERLLELKRANFAAGLVGASQKGLHPYDRINRNDSDYLSLRQRIDVWERRMHSAQAEDRYAAKVAQLKAMRAYDAAQKGEVVADVDMLDSNSKPTMPCIPGQEETILPPFPLWALTRRTDPTFSTLRCPPGSLSTSTSRRCPAANWRQPRGPSAPPIKSITSRSRTLRASISSTSQARLGPCVWRRPSLTIHTP
jgi:hypothetical protein